MGEECHEGDFRVSCLCADFVRKSSRLAVLCAPILKYRVHRGIHRGSEVFIGPGCGKLGIGKARLARREFSH